STSCVGMQWLYQMYDDTLGTGPYKKCGTRSVGSGTNVWSGFEVRDSNDQMGGAGIDASMNRMSFKYDGNWLNLSDTTVYTGVGDPSGWTQTYWVTTSSLNFGFALIKSHTNAH